jgi:iron complex transport system ATP-binding protein
VTLVVENLGHAYRRVEALADIGVRAAEGRVTAVIGPNAAGKSTLLRCAIGGLVPTQGRVLIDGEPAHRLSTTRLAQRIAYVPQRSVVSASFTVREVVELGRYALAPSRRRIDDALEQLDLVQIAERPYPTLSVGQQQRAALARAVAQLSNDGHLILDEPTSAMDLRHVRETMTLLRRVAGDGATVLVAIHDLMLAASTADECWLLDEGRLVAAGPTQEVMDLERLRAVFGVGFEWVSRPGRNPALLAETEP